MSAAEQEFEAGGHKFGAGRVRHRGRQSRGARAVDQGARPVGVGGGRRAERADARPRRAAHRLRPHVDQHAGRRLGAAGVRQLQGALHLLRRAEAARRQPASRSTTSSSFRTPGQGGSALITGGVQGNEPRPYKKTETTPNVGTVDSTDDMRGSIGVEGLMELYKFVQEGGVLITEGATSTVFPEYNLTPGVSHRNARQPLRARLGAEGAARRSRPARCCTATTRTRWRSISIRRR